MRFSAWIGAILSIAILLTAVPTSAQVTWKLPPTSGGWEIELNVPQPDMTAAINHQTTVYDLDAEYTTAAQVAQLHSLGQYVVGYVTIGAYEDYRPDASQFPRSVIGPNTGWGGEYYLDIRPAALNLYKAIMERRFDVAKNKGFDALDGDYQNNISDCPGIAGAACFPTSVADQEGFNQWFIGAAHARGMAVVLKNAPEYATKYASWPDATHPGGYDAALNEECNRYQECGNYVGFSRTGRPVFQVEYTNYWGTTNLSWCANDTNLGLQGLLKDVQLNSGWRKACGPLTPAPTATAPAPTRTRTPAPTATGVPPTRTPTITPPTPTAIPPTVTPTRTPGCV